MSGERQVLLEQDSTDHGPNNIEAIEIPEVINTGLLGRFFPLGFWYEFKKLVQLAIPITITFLVAFLSGPISVIFCGRLGKSALATVGLAVSVFNVTGLAVITGLLTAVETLFAQTYGGRNKHMMGIQLQRASVIVTLCCMPCIALHLMAEPLLLLLKQNPITARTAAEYLTYMSPGLWNRVYPPLFIGIIANGFNALLHYLLLFVADIGVKGSAISQVATYAFQCILMLFYIVYTERNAVTWQGWSKKLWLDWDVWFKLAMPGVFMTTLEWTIFELGSLVAGTLGEKELASQAILFNIEAMSYTLLPLGFGAATSIRLGHFLGAGSAVGPRSVLSVALFTLWSVSIVFILIIILLRWYIPRIFTSDESVIELSARLLPVIAVFQIFDGTVGACSGAIRGAGLQVIGAVVCFITLYVIGAPVGLLLVYLAHYNLEGLWAGMTVGTVVEGVAYCIICMSIDWEKQVQRALERTKDSTASIREYENHHCSTETIPEFSGMDEDHFLQDHHPTLALPERKQPVGCSTELPTFPDTPVDGHLASYRLRSPISLARGSVSGARRNGAHTIVDNNNADGWPYMTESTNMLSGQFGMPTVQRPFMDPTSPGTSTTNGSIAHSTVQNGQMLTGSHTTSPVSSSTEGSFVALHDYVKRVDDDLGMTKGQTFRVLDQSHSDWWYVQCTSTGLQGYVPRNHLAAVTSLESNEWHFGEMRRIEAEHYLQLPGNDHGSFLVRLSESQMDEYSLSVREENHIKHYRIRSRSSRAHPELLRYYISRQLPFVNIQQLIAHYLENQSGLCCRLRRPCIKPTHPEPVGLSHKLIDKWEIPKSSIVLKEKIGHGQFGEVYKAVWNKTTIVAVKTLKPSSCDAADFLREAQVMKRLNHPNLIQLYAVCTQSEPFYLVTEFMSKGSLLAYLQTTEGRQLELECLVMMAVKIASGMAYLELKRHIHRDLAARNVLVGEQHVVKIADFGLARMIHNREYVAHAGARFPIKWTAPEAANYSRFTTKSDIWSFGILLTEIVTYGRSPYPGMHNAEVLRQVEAGYRMSKPPGCPPELYDLMLDCWAADENRRPSFSAIQIRLEEFCENRRPAYRGSLPVTQQNPQSLLPQHTRGANATPITNGRVSATPKAFQSGIQIPVSP